MAVMAVKSINGVDFRFCRTDNFSVAHVADRLPDHCTQGRLIFNAKDGK